MVTFFGVNKSGISRHIKDILENNELDMSSVAQNATNVVTSDGKTERTNYRSSKVYNLDMITLVGSRVKSNRIVKFRN